MVELAVEEVYAQGFRPGWLADDREWRDQLASMHPSDIVLLHESWHLAGGAPPAVPGPQLDWVTFDRIR